MSKTFNVGDLVEIKEYNDDWDGMQGTFSRYDNASTKTIAFFKLTKDNKNKRALIGGYKDGAEIAMYTRNLFVVHRPEEMICEDWS